MAFVPNNYLTARQALAQISTDATSYYFNGERAVDQLATSAANLLGMPTQWQAAVDFIDAQAASESGTDRKWRDLKVIKDQMVTDFLAMRDKMQSVRDAAQAALGA